MFECDYKFSLKDAIKCAKYVYKSGRKKQEKAIAIAIPILLVITIAMLVVDITTGRKIVWDIVLIVSMLVLGGLTYAMPLIIVRAQKKQYNEQNFADMDSLHIKITNGILEESMMKDGEARLSNTHNLKTLVGYIEDDEDIILMYNSGEYTCIKKANLKGDSKRFCDTLKKAMTVKSKK